MLQPKEPVLPWAAEVLQGLYNSLGMVNNGQPLGLAEKMKLLVQSPAALEDALACLLGNSDVVLRVRTSHLAAPPPLPACLACRCGCVPSRPPAST